MLNLLWVMLIKFSVVLRLLESFWMILYRNGYNYIYILSDVWNVESGLERSKVG